MTYSPECVAAFEAKFIGIRRRAEGAGFWFDFDAGAYDGHEKYKPQIDEANSLIYAFAANWERVKELEEALAALEQGEAVEYWVLFDASGGRKFIKKEVGSGVLAFFDDEFAAKAAKRANPGTDYQKVVYYKAPPSTAEQWKPSGAEYDRNIHHNTDASAWADFFMATFPNCGADRDTMLGWFANAMMAVADSQPSTAEVEAQATELALWLVMDEWEANLDDWTAEGIKNTLLSEAKRLREEG